MTLTRRTPVPVIGRDSRKEDPQAPVVLGAKAAPMSARAREAQRIVQLVTEGTSVEIVGVRWAGRSEVLRQVHRTLTSMGLTVLTVSGTGSPLPLEAVRAALPPASRKTIADGGGTAAAVGDTLVRYLSDGPSVVVVDDGDLLDEASWTLLVSAHKLLGRPVITSSLRSAPARGSEHLLAKVAHPMVQVALDELRLETLHALLQDRVDGTLSPAVSARIHTKSAGIPGLAVALLDGAIAQGLVRRSGDHWVSGAVLWSQDMRGAFETMLYAYRPQVRDALELLSVAGTMDLGSAWVLLGPELVEELEGHELVRLSSVGAGSCPVLSVHPPGIGDYFLHQPLTARRERIVDEAVTRLTHAGDTISVEGRGRLMARLRPTRTVTVGSTPGHVAMHSIDVPVVSRMFTDAYRIDLAAARDRWEEMGDRRSAALYLQLQLTGASDPEEVERVIAGVAHAPADDDPSELSLRYAQSRWLVTQGATVEEAVRPLVEDVPEGFAHGEALDTLARAVRWEREALDPRYVDVLGPRAARTGLDAQVAGVVLAVCHMMAGRVEDSLAVIDAIEGDLRAVERTAVGLLRGLALYATGRFAEVDELATEQIRSAISDLDRLAFAGYSYLGALAQIALGRLEEAQTALAVVLGSGIISRPISFAPDRAVLVAMSVISTRTGHAPAAASFLGHAAQVLGTTDALPLGSPLWGEAVAIAGSGETAVAAETFAELIADARGRGYALAADTATMASLFLHYDPVLAESFRDRAGRIGGSLYVAYLDAWAATHSRDPQLLESAARVLQGHGAHSEALKCFTLAARLYRDEGQSDRAADARSAARAVTEDLGATGLVASGRGELGFTTRELEIIRLVAAGRSNNEIAEDLVLSIRTVESHLRNIRRKSGAVEREDIASFGRAD